MESERLVISGPGPGTIRLGPDFWRHGNSAPGHTIHCPALSVEIVGATIRNRGPIRSGWHNHRLH